MGRGRLKACVPAGGGALIFFLFDFLSYPLLLPTITRSGFFLNLKTTIINPVKERNKR